MPEDTNETEAPKQRLLVVDDIEENRDLLARRLKRRGYDVDMAEDGPTALAMVAATPYDCLLLDIMMPGMSGLEVLEKLRVDYTSVELPILMATAKSDSEDMVKALELGANDYVTKPIDFPVVLARLQTHMGMSKQFASMAVPAAILNVDGGAEPGTVLDGRYEVIGPIGEGGFAVVLKCKQLSTGQEVALKLLRAHRVAALSIASVELARFEREMKLIGQLNHEHIVRLIDSGTIKVQSQGGAHTSGEWSAGGTDSVPPTRDSAEFDEPITGGGGSGSALTTVPYIVMEFLDGDPLSALLRREAPLAVDRAIQIILPVLSALATAHEAGVIHRDLKPPNIFITDGTGGRPMPKVLDFGIAKLSNDDASQLTMDEGFVGTPEYMAPEQARGETEIDRQADQYAIGVMFYECITGRRPYQSESFIELVHLIAKGEFQPPSAFVTGIPFGLEDVLLRALDADPRRRFSSVQAFGRALLPFARPDTMAAWASSFDVPEDAPLPPKPKFQEREHMAVADTVDGHSVEPPPNLREAPAVDVGRERESIETLSTVAREIDRRSDDKKSPLTATLAVASLVLVAAGAWFVGRGSVQTSAAGRGGTYELSVSVSPDEARVELDGETLPNGHVERTLALDGESHTLRVSAPGHVPHTFTFRDAPPPANVSLDEL